MKTTTQRRRTLMRKLDNSKIEGGQDQDVFVQVEQLVDELENMGEPISKHRVMDIILSGMTSE